MANLTNIQDMMAQNPQTGESILLMFENLAIIPGASDYTAEAFAEELAQGLEETDALPYVVGEIGTQTLGGNEYVVVPATLDGYELCQHYLIRREGNFMVELILTGVGRRASRGSWRCSLRRHFPGKPLPPAGAARTVRLLFLLRF